jgi:hypothetical protein
LGSQIHPQTPQVTEFIINFRPVQEKRRFIKMSKKGNVAPGASGTLGASNAMGIKDHSRSKERTSQSPNSSRAFHSSKDNKSISRI